MKTLFAIWQNIKALMWGIVFSTLLLEVACIILVETGYLPTRVPTYSLSTQRLHFWNHLNEHFGAWHYPNSEAVHTGACFDETYHFNAHGMRDKARPFQSERKRVLVIGDSFVEGYGVCDSCRITDHLETLSGMPHLNFGCSGGVGPTQHYLIYDKLAKQFDHEAIMVGILPDNDFRDDTPDPNRYHPYWEGHYPNYTLQYSGPEHFIPEPEAQELEIKNGVKWYLRNFTYTMNVIDWVEGYLKWQSNTHRQAQKIPRGTSRFERFTAEEFNRMRYSLEQLRSVSGEKPLIVFLIPRFSDLLHFDQTQENPLLVALQEKVALPNTYYVDLLSLLYHTDSQNWTSYYLTCDRHWSPAGHEMAAALLYSHLDSILY